MAWERSTRHYQPADWKTLRAAVLAEHGGICHVCGQPGGTEVDHVIAQCEGGTDDPSNLRPIHAKPCHVHKTAGEAARAKARIYGSRRRPPEKHPGLL